MDSKLLQKWFYQMDLIRRFEEKCAEFYAYGKIGGFLHLYIGEEAVAVGALSAVTEEDHLLTHYRDHGWALARGTDPGRLMAELLGKATGVSKGKGGSMHLCDPERHFYGGYAIVGGHLPLAAGIGFAMRYQGSDRVVIAAFGDGATNIGEFHEAMNMAALWKLPIIFVCENNLYGMGTDVSRASSVPDIAQKACAYGMPGEQCNGMVIFSVYEAMQKAVARARAGEGPTLLEARTYRYRGHSMADPELYRERQEVEEFRECCDPIEFLRRKMIEQGAATPEALEDLEHQAERAVAEAARFAEESPPPPPEWLYEDVYVKPVGTDARKEDR